MRPTGSRIENQKMQHFDLEEDDEVMYKKDNSALLTGMSIAFAEFIGTALLVYITCMGCTAGMSIAGIPALQSYLASGFGVLTAVQLFSHISGAHVNPAVTVCAVIMGKISLMTAAIYVASQIAGSLTGYALLMAVTPNQYLAVPQGHCVTTPHPDISLIQAVVVEAVATVMMCLAVCATWDSRTTKRMDSLPIRIGLIAVVINITAGPYSGGSINPARSFAPAVWNGQLTTNWVYWIGPLLGACASGIFYKKIFYKKATN